MLLERKAKLSATDARGDSALHVAMRSRSRAIVEVLLRNPKHSQLLYREDVEFSILHTDMSKKSNDRLSD